MYLIAGVIIFFSLLCLVTNVFALLDYDEDDETLALFYSIFAVISPECMICSVELIAQYIQNRREYGAMFNYKSMLGDDDSSYGPADISEADSFKNFVFVGSAASSFVVSTNTESVHQPDPKNDESVLSALNSPIAANAAIAVISDESDLSSSESQSKSSATPKSHHFRHKANKQKHKQFGRRGLRSKLFGPDDSNSSSRNLSEPSSYSESPSSDLVTSIFITTDDQ